MNKSTVRKIVVVVIAVFVLTLIAYPLIYSPTNLEPGIDGTDVDIQTPAAPGGDLPN